MGSRSAEAAIVLPVEGIDPIRVNVPLYVTIQDAAKICGVNEAMMRNWTRCIDPIPYIQQGNRKLIRVSAIEEYAKRKEAV